ncbi:MAG: hypothetical protein ACKVOE_09825 [Rickettsiales bacterium]
MNHGLSTFFVCCVLACGVAACDAPAKKKDVWNLYDTHNSNAQKAGIPLDYDSYYRKPNGYSCNTIADLPSCGSD